MKATSSKSRFAALAILRNGRRALLSLGFGALLLIALEGVISLYMANFEARTVPNETREHVHSEYDPELGWMHLPDHRAENVYGRGIHLTTNAQRLRGTRNHTAEVPAGRYRVVCLGDSFTMGHGVGDDETYAARMEELSPTLETVNMGMGGFGVDQSYLWYLRDGVALETDLLLAAFVYEDFYRMLFPAFLSRYPKPQLVLEEGELRTVGVPVATGWEKTAWEHLETAWNHTALKRFLSAKGLTRETVRTLPFDPRALPFAGPAEAVLADLARLSHERDQGFVLVYLPVRIDLVHEFPEVSDWMRAAAERLEIPFLDLTDDLKSLTPSERKSHFLRDGHYTELGNRRVAELLVEKLREVVPDFP